MKLGKINDIAVHKLRKFGIFHRHLLRGNIHTQFATQNVKITFSVQPTQVPLKTSGMTKYFCCCKTSNIGTIENRATAKGLFDQNRKYYNHNNKTLHLVSHIALQATSLISTTEPSSSFPGGSDRHALLLRDFEIILNLDKILVRVMRYCVIKSAYIGTTNCRWNWFLFFKCENVNFLKQSK